MRHAWLAAPLPALFLLGCGDPIVGRWEGDDPTVCAPGRTDRVEFEIQDDYRGSGDVCSCNFDFDIEERSSGRYRVDIHFSGVCFAVDGVYDCELIRDDSALDCDQLGVFVPVDG